MKALVKVNNYWVESEVLMDSNDISICDHDQKVILKTSIETFMDLVDLGEIIPQVLLSND